MEPPKSSAPVARFRFITNFSIRITPVAKKDESVLRTRATKQEEVVAKWHLVDAADQTVGRLATRVATILRGKHKPTFSPHVDTGDFVVVVNAEKVKMT